MRNENSKYMTDVELMNLAKKRIMLRNYFKWHKRIFAMATVVTFSMSFLLGGGHIEIALFILGWWLLVMVHGASVWIRLSDVNTSVSEEYYHLKRFALSKK